MLLKCQEMENRKILRKFRLFFFTFDRIYVIFFTGFSVVTGSMPDAPLHFHYYRWRNRSGGIE